MSEYLFSFYGDDFTGSTDALESLASNGIPAVLFLDPPSDEALKRFPGCRAVGIAGESRSRDPEWMSEQLPAVFARLKQLQAGICQYKVCSTFDSSPRAGSIGRALEIGQDIFGTQYVPVAVAAPHLGRYVLFGNLFAAGGGAIHRIDRHPAMRNHPVTPMNEGDLRLHLARQTSRRSGLLDVLGMLDEHPESRLRELIADTQHPEIVFFDGLDRRTQVNLGRLLWDYRPAENSFAVGSSGLIQALAQRWRELGHAPQNYVPAKPSSTDRLVVISGSCSPATENQIRWAVANGFSGIRVNPEHHDPGPYIHHAVSALESGQSIVLYTALGAGDRNQGSGGEALGRKLGVLLRQLLSVSGVRRAVVAGGDTSSHAVRQLDIEALTFAGLTAPGAPLCRCHAPGRAVDGLELVLKGGQVGPDNFFEIVREGNQ